MPSDLARREALWALPVSVALIALAWVPPLPIAGAQASDVIGASGVLLALYAAQARLSRGVSAWPVSRAALVAGGAYIAWAAVSMVATHGSRVRVLGTWWLVVLAAGVAVYASESEAHAQRIRRAVIAAAVIGAITGLVGALLFAFGVETGLLNTAGDLVPGHYPRIRGTMMRANALAGLLAAGMLLVGLAPCAASRAVDDVSRRWRIPILATLGAALVFTFSRSWIALAGAGAVYVLALGERRSRARDVAAVTIVLACIATMIAVSWPGIRFDPLHPWTISTTGEPGTRWLHLSAALQTIAEHPLFGVGPGRMADPSGWDSHFSLANVAAIYGIPAVLAYASIVGIALVRAVRAARSSVAPAAAARGVAAALVLFMLDALARDIEDQRVLWVLVGLALALPAARNDKRPPQEPSHRPSA
jgi:hypothetical protein